MWAYFFSYVSTLPNDSYLNSSNIYLGIGAGLAAINAMLTANSPTQYIVKHIDKRLDS